MEDITRYFVRIGPGKWTCVRSADLAGPNGRIQVAIGSTFTIGQRFMGIDVARWLEEEPRREELKSENGSMRPQPTLSGERRWS